MVSPTFRRPFTNTTSIVVPRPSMTLTSSTVHSNVSFSSSASLWEVWPILQRYIIRSLRPSPVMAEVGQKLIVSSRESLFQYKETLKPSSLKASWVFWSYVWKWFLALYVCLSSVSLVFMSVFGFQVFKRSILLSAMQKGVPFYFRSWIDSRVYYSKPCMISTTKTAISHRLDPLERRLVKDSWPGVSITRKPGISKSMGSICAILVKCFYKFSPGK